MKKQSKIVLVILILSVFIICLTLINIYQSKAKEEKEWQSAQATVSSQINKDEKKEQKITKKLSQKQEKIENILKETKGSLSISYYDFNVKKGFNIDGDNLYNATSMLGLPISIVLAENNSSLQNIKDILDNKDASKTELDKIGGLSKLSNKLSEEFHEDLAINSDEEPYFSTNQLVNFLNIIKVNQQAKNFKEIIQVLQSNQSDLISSKNDKWWIYNAQNDYNQIFMGYCNGKNKFLIAIITSKQNNQIDKELKEIGKVLVQ